MQITARRCKAYVSDSVCICTLNYSKSPGQAGVKMTISGAQPNSETVNF